MGIVIRGTGGSDSPLGSSVTADSTKISNVKILELISRARSIGHVHRDYDRAEELYRRAIKANPSDIHVFPQLR